MGVLIFMHLKKNAPYSWPPFALYFHKPYGPCK